MIDQARLATLIHAKILHDLATPIGIVGNSIEMLDDKSLGVNPKQAFDILRSSAATAAARVKFNREAYATREETDRFGSIDEARGWLTAFVDSPKIQLVWASGPSSAPVPVVKLLLNLCSLGLEILQRTGILSVEISDLDGAYHIIVTAKAPQVQIKQLVMDALAGRDMPHDLQGRDAQPFYVRNLADRIGCELTAREEVESVCFIAKTRQMAMN